MDGLRVGAGARDSIASGVWPQSPRHATQADAVVLRACVRADLRSPIPQAEKVQQCKHGWMREEVSRQVNDVMQIDTRVILLLDYANDTCATTLGRFDGLLSDLCCESMY